MNIYQKLVEVRKSVPYLKKESQGHQYQYTGSSQVLAAVRNKMDELGLMLVCKVLGHTLTEGKTAKGAKEYMTELDIEFTWVNADNPEETIVCPWYGQGVDNSEKGVGKCLTYAEKYFMLKTFNIATDKDDPDSFQEKAETYHKPNPISAKEVGDLKVKILEFAELREKTEADVFKAVTEAVELNVNNIESLTSKDAKVLTAKLTGWINSARKEIAKNQKQGA